MWVDDAWPRKIHIPFIKIWDTVSGYRGAEKGENETLMMMMQSLSNLIYVIF